MSIPSILTGAAGRALRTLEPLAMVAQREAGAARSLINGARGDITAALGAGRVSAFSSELHAAARNLGSGFGGASTIDDALRELSTAARSTAKKRVIIGSLGVGGAIAGLIAARNVGVDRGDQIAPGPLPQPGAPGGGGGGSGGSWS